MEEQTGGTLLAEEPKTEQAWYPPEYKDIVDRTGWKEPGDAIKSYRELEKSASGKIKLPTESSSPEEISAFYAKIRGVDTPEGYQVEVPENVPIDADMIGKLRQWAFEAGAPKTAFETVLRNYLQELADQYTQSIENGKKALQDEWKNDYDVNLKLAQRFVANDCSPEFRTLLIETGLGNNPVFVKEFLNLAKKTATDTLIKGETTNTEDKDWKPNYPDSPDMYRYGDDDYSRRAREWFRTTKGYNY